MAEPCCLVRPYFAIATRNRPTSGHFKPAAVYMAEWFVLGCWTLLPSTLFLPFRADAAPGPAEQPVDYMVVVTGGELLLGVYADGHTHFLTRTLRPLGLRCVGSMSVDDRRADIEQALRFATGKTALVIVTGGLGPTDNDVTRETLSEFTGVALREHPSLLQALERRFQKGGGRLRSNLRRQTQVPASGTYLKNANGTAVGLVFQTDDFVIVALPGPPRELQPMVRNELVPYLSRRFGTRLPGCSLTLRFVGIGQSGIDQTLKDHVPLPSDVVLSSQFEGMRVDFTFSLPNDTTADRARLQELKQRILKHLGDRVYADDETSLEQHVMRLFEARGAMLAVAEAGTGGRLAAALCGADGSSRVLAGAYVAPTAARLRQLLRVPDDEWTATLSSPQKVERLAAAAAEGAGSLWAVAVGQSQVDLDGTRSVDVAFKGPEGRFESHHLRLRGVGESARSRLTTELLDRLRRRLR